MTRRGDAIGPLPTGDSATPPQGGTGVSGRGEKKYAVNEIFYSLQGEGARAGTANVFVRFAGCNLTCSEATEGFDCDTEFTSHRKMTGDEIAAEARALLPSGTAEARDDSSAVIFTGGEPALQLDEDLLLWCFGGWYTAVETNGTKQLPRGLAWVCVSPKTAEHTLVSQLVNELKYVRRHGQGIPKPALNARYLYISPAFGADGRVDARDLAWCIELVKQHPSWRLSMQQHKIWGVR
jgi:organic radical activating enzyme